MGKTLDSLQSQLLVVEMRHSFINKNIEVYKILLLSESPTMLSIILKNGDKVIVREAKGSYVWSLNKIQKGEVIGDTIFDVAGDYEFEISKDLI